MFVLYALQEFMQMWCRLKGKSQGQWAQLRRARIHYTTRDGLPSGLSGKESAYQCKRHRFDPWVRKIPWRSKWQPIPIFLPGKPMDRGAWWATAMGLQKDTTEQLNNHQQWRSPACAWGRGKSSFPLLPRYCAQCGSRVVAKKKKKKSFMIYISYHWSTNVMSCMEERLGGRMGDWGGRGKSLSRKGRRLE